ncbi:MAG: hypothetical protein RQ859_03790 [Pyrobaculum sp.]|nr:hypothetical protein [Pyrobaculum sp.]
MRRLAAVAAFALLAALAAVVLFFFFGSPRGPAEKGPADGHTAVTQGAAASINVVPSSAGGLLCVVAGGDHLRYVVTDEKGHVVYNGSGPPPCPPARPGSYVYKAARRDGGFDVATVAVGDVSLQFAADKLSAVVNDYMRTAEVEIRATLTNPQSAYVVVTGITATAGAPGFACSELKIDKPLVIPPGGSVAVELGSVKCNATDDYLYGLGGAPTTLTVSGKAYYGNLQISEVSQPLVSINTPAPRPGSFAASDGSCRVGNIPPGEKPVYYVLLSGASPVARGAVAETVGGYAVVPCPASSGFFRYRVVTASGSVVEVPVAVGRVLASAESNMTAVQVNAAGQVVFFDLYLRFTNPNAGYTALNYTYTLKYNTNLLDCSLHAGRLVGSLTLQPGETKTIRVATYRCLVLSKFREAKIAVDVTATYTGGGISTTLYKGTTEGLSFVMSPPPACPATLVYVNQSLFPLLSASWTHVGSHNVTTLTMKVFPGWPEDYVLATLAPTEQPQWLSPLRKDFSGSALYSIYLGGLLQFNESSPGPGPSASLPAPLRWSTTTETGYVASADASVPAICTYPLLSLKAQPMSILHQQTFTCGTSRLYDNFSNYCTGTKCVLPANIKTYVNGKPYTGVYLDPKTSPTSPPSLVTQVDARGSSNRPFADWGAAIAVYQLPHPVPAYGTSVSVWGRYVRDVYEAQNNVAYLSIGVDTNGDGQVDKEYIIYRYDVSSPFSGAIVSAFFRDVNGNPVYVCTVDSAGRCTATDPRFVVVNAGSMDTGNNYQWSYTLYERGAVVAVAFTAVDASFYDDSARPGDVWVFWDDLTIEYSACPPPAVWSVDGRYVWQSYNYLLVSGSATAYMPLVANALTYVANFSGVGTYAVFDSSLGVIFGVSVNGSSFTALCRGASVPLGSLPATRYVELRPFNGLGDIIIRDRYGTILARHSCRYVVTPRYVGFSGGLLRVYSVEAWG